MFYGELIETYSRPNLEDEFKTKCKLKRVKFLKLTCPQKLWILQMLKKRTVCWVLTWKSVKKRTNEIDFLVHFKQRTLGLPWRSLCASTAGGAGSNPGQGTKTPTLSCGQKQTKGVVWWQPLPFGPTCWIQKNLTMRLRIPKCVY